MSYSAKTTYYFNNPGPENTRDSAAFAVERAKELGLDKIVVASSGGMTAEIFYEAIKNTGIQLIVVTHVVGFSKPGIWEFPTDKVADLESKGVRIIKGTHALSGLERAISRSQKLGGSSRTEAIAEALRRTVAVGLKVAVECTLIAADQGEVPVDSEIVAVGGTATGADTVCVIKPAHTADYFSLQVREIVAMPRNR
ncbi:pyruvate kinase alpha/beta domain-containing protein [Methanolacinia petrolearia]|uniref:pyruvate kinase alpha/beta domain-containing protein n=1 Tax=Methanolacinia petrolearia TaxID=54120 RepID=UPI003BA9F095